MKNINLISIIILVLINTLLGLIIKEYHVMNFMIADLILILHFILRNTILNSNANDAFKISHGFITSFFTFVSFISSIFIPNKIQDNIPLIILIIIIGIQVFFSLSGITIFKKETE